MTTYISNEFYNKLNEDEKFLVDEVVRYEAGQGNLIKFMDGSEIWQHFAWGDAILSKQQYEGSIPLPSVEDLCIYTYQEVHNQKISKQNFDLLEEQNILCTQDPTAYRAKAYNMRRREEVGAVAYINEKDECLFSYVANTGKIYEQKIALDQLNEKVKELAETVNVEVKTIEKDQKERTSFSDIISKVKEKFSTMLNNFGKSEERDNTIQKS